MNWDKEKGFKIPPICKVEPLSSTKSHARAQQNCLWEATQINLNWVGKTLPICLFWLWCQPVKACEDRDTNLFILLSPTWRIWRTPGGQDVRGCRLCYGTTAPSCPPSQSLVQNRALECWGDAANHGPNPGVTKHSLVTEWSLHREQGSLWCDRKERLRLPVG